MLIAALKFLQRWCSRGTDSLSGLGFQLLVMGCLIMEIIAIRKITVQNAKVESVRKPPLQGLGPKLDEKNRELIRKLCFFSKLT